MTFFMNHRDDTTDQTIRQCHDVPAESFEEEFARLLENSSLGTPNAQAIQALTADAVVNQVHDRAEACEHSDRTPGGTTDIDDVLLDVVRSVAAPPDCRHQPHVIAYREDLPAGLLIDPACGSGSLLSWAMLPHLIASNVYDYVRRDVARSIVEIVFRDGREGVDLLMPIAASALARSGVVDELAHLFESIPLPATGQVTNNDIAEATAAYVPPQSYPEAVSALRADHVVTLVGPTGAGKRTAALVLLRAMTTGELYLLSPAVSISELADQPYIKGAGYAVIDHLTEQTNVNDEITWRVLRNRLSAAGSYLVVTTTTEPAVTSDAVRRIQWLQPDFELVLRKRMSAALAENDWAVLTEALAAARTVRDVVRLAERLEHGEPPATAVDQTSQAVVSQWFGQEPSRRQIAEVTTLSFALGTTDRVFEPMLAAFERALHRAYMPEPNSSDEVPIRTSLPQRRQLPSDASSLIVRRTVPSDLGPHCELVFAAPGYHRHILGELRNRMGVAFWNALRGWLDEMVTVDGPRVAFGLARLAEVALDDVLALLEFWSAGSRGLNGQLVSLLVISAMAVEDTLAPVALLTASRWVTSRDVTQRRTAAMAFGDNLGVRYPHPASNQLWQLCTQAHTTTGNTSVALAQLFVTLVSRTSDAGIVLSLLASKLDRFSRPGGNPTMYAAAVSATLAVLCAHDPVSGRKAFLLYLEQFPDRVDTIARLWGTVLRNRPSRLRAIKGLLAAVEELAEHDERPAYRVRQFATGLTAAIPTAEHNQLLLDMRFMADDRQRIDSDALTALLTTLVRTVPADQEST